MNKSKGLVLVLTAAALNFTACASSTLSKKVDVDVASETSVNNRESLQANASKTMESANLTPEQKTNLKTLRESTKAQMDNLGQESLKLRAVLIKDLVAKPYSGDEVSLVERKIKQVEEKRLNVMFAAVDKANTILGHEQDTAGHRQFMEDFWHDSINRNDF